MEFTKNKSFFVGIDSDGTVFDSMTIKHTYSFIPASIEVFGLQSCADEFKRIAEKVNLYSLDRGINRFPGQYMALKELEKKGLFSFTGLEDFNDYINSGMPFSNASLEEWLQKHPSEFNEKILKWSRLGDEYFEKLTDNIPPFDGVNETVELMHKTADVMVVSAASYKGLLKDWSNAQLTGSVDFIAGQEFGNKASQLTYAKEKGFDGEQMLMLGDAPGDYAAAKKAGAYFYPIVPGREVESWMALKTTYFDMFTKGKYTSATEEALYNEFIKNLKGESQ